MLPILLMLTCLAALELRCSTFQFLIYLPMMLLLLLSVILTSLLMLMLLMMLFLISLRPEASFVYPARLYIH